MRPPVTVPESDQFECIACGRRARAPDDRQCSHCGGSLRDLTNSRDL